MSYRPLTPYHGELSTAIADDEAYEMNATRSVTNDTLHVADTGYHPLASWEDTRTGDHPVITANDDAHETNATRSAPHNTVRAVDDFYYRPLASSDDVCSGASSHVEAYGPSITIDSISSVPRQGEMTDDPGSNSSTLRGSSEELPRSKALERLTAAYIRGALDSWFYEYTALVFSVGCLAALVIILGIYNGKETPQLPYNITLNALISVLSTAARSSLLFAVAGTLGQLKWVWFMDSRELSDMQTFDSATRGPWGALVLLCSRSIRPLASMGAVITIVTLAYGPFLQQLVRYPVIYNSVLSYDATTKKATSLDATANFSNWDSARVAAWLDIDRFDRETPGCPTGNCTWPTFTSLEYCTKCGDTTAETSLKCSAVFQKWDAKSNETCEIHPDQGYPATVWQGLIANNSTDWSYSTVDSIVWVVRLTSAFGSNDALYTLYNTPDPEPNSAFQSTGDTKYSYLGVENPTLVLGYASFDTKPRLYDGSTLSGSSTPIFLKAETCIITPCERTHQLSMTAGQLRTVVIDTDYGVSDIRSDGSRCWRTTSYRGIDDASVLPVKDCTLRASGEPTVTACHGGDATSGYTFCIPDDAPDLGAYLGSNNIGLLGRVGSKARREGNTITHEHGHPEENADVTGLGFPTVGKTTYQAIQAHNFSYLMERMAASMTKVELDKSSTLVYGNMTFPVVHVEVAWQWFILPAALNALAIFLLLATAVLSHRRKTQLWKSSTLALLYHGLDNPEPAPNLTMANVSEMERCASATSARLGSVKDGGRAVLRNLPHGQAPKD